MLLEQTYLGSARLRGTALVQRSQDVRNAKNINTQCRLAAKTHSAADGPTNADKHDLSRRGLLATVAIGTAWHGAACEASPGAATFGEKMPGMLMTELVAP